MIGEREDEIKEIIILIIIIISDRVNISTYDQNHLLPN